MKTGLIIHSFLLVLIAISFSLNSFAHCDSYDGPLIKDAIKALESENVSLALKWIPAEDEPEIISLFNKTIALKSGDKEIYSIVEEHFLETLVRLHRQSEGESFTGLKPAGSASPIVVMADLALENHSPDDLLQKLSNHINFVLREKFQKAAALYEVKDRDPETGRQFVASYVDYTHTLETLHKVIESDQGHHGH